MVAYVPEETVSPRPVESNSPKARPLALIAGYGDSEGEESSENRPERPTTFNPLPVNETIENDPELVNFLKSEDGCSQGKMNLSFIQGFPKNLLTLYISINKAKYPILFY